ncbi:amine oxidase [Dyadobacter luticola]|uniref:Amine oxidase n=2 Tax=Dyadobacter luticola TaxID=1979387 RepID=A0A5R9L6X8_9BACT|nr:amine oxidase [Dyadobacter luticola]
MAGFECADQLNAFGDRVDLLTETAHIELIREDYERISALGIKTVREGIRWSVVEPKPYQYDFKEVIEMIVAAKDLGIQQLWDVCHFGFPDDLTPFHPKFHSRFVSLCLAFLECYTRHNPGEMLYVTPVNEVSFLSWLGGDAGGTVPYCRKNGWDVKYALTKEFIGGAQAMKMASDRVRIVTTEPLVNMVPGLFPTWEDTLQAEKENELQFQSLDMLLGRICPELGGYEELVDIVGFNYYYNNQWITGSFQFLGWNDPVPDPRWKPLADLIENAYQRYGKPLIISETSHPKEDRPLWIDMIGEQCAALLRRDVPLLGVCLYPIIDRPDWDNLHIWHQAGIWDYDGFDKKSRVLHEESAIALFKAQLMLDDCLALRTIS